MIDLREGAGRTLILQGGLLLTMIKHRRPRAVSKVAPITHISLYLHIPAKGTRDSRLDAASHASRAIGVG